MPVLDLEVVILASAQSKGPTREPISKALTDEGWFYRFGKHRQRKETHPLGWPKVSMNNL